jgi:hypothetical protein
VPEVVEPDAEDAGVGERPFVGGIEVARLDVPAGRGGEDQASLRPVVVSQAPVVGLTSPVAGQRLDDDGRRSQRSS